MPLHFTSLYTFLPCLTQLYIMFAHYFLNAFLAKLIKVDTECCNFFLDIKYANRINTVTLNYYSKIFYETFCCKSCQSCSIQGYYWVLSFQLVNLKLNEPIQLKIRSVFATLKINQRTRKRREKNCQKSIKKNCIWETIKFSLADSLGSSFSSHYPSITPPFPRRGDG